MLYARTGGAGEIVWTRFHSHASMLRRAIVLRGTQQQLGLPHSPGPHSPPEAAVQALPTSLPSTTSSAGASSSADGTHSDSPLLCAFGPRFETVDGVDYDRMPVGSGDNSCRWSFTPNETITTVVWLQPNAAEKPFHMHATLAFVVAFEAA